MAESNTSTEVVIPPQSQEEQNQDMLDILADPEIQDLYQQAFPEAQDNATVAAQQPVLPQDPDEIDQGTFWDIHSRAYELTESAQQESNKAIGEPIAKGILKGAAGILDTAASAATTISAETGLYKLGRNDEQEKAFLEWYNKPGAEQVWGIDGTNIQVTRLDRKVDEIMGPSRGGISGFVEGATQFGVGMLGAARMLKAGVGGFGMGALRGSGALETGAKILAKGGKFGKYVAGTLGFTLKGAIADATFFNPWEKKLADMVENGPEFLSNPITRYLQTDINDSEAEARLKRALEGVMLGEAVSGFVKVLRVMKVRFSYKTGAIDKNTAENLMEQAGDALELADNAVDDVVRVVETGDGRFAVEGLDDAGFKQTDLLTPLPKPKQGVPPVQQYGFDPNAPDAIKTKALDDAAVKQEQAATDAFGPEPRPPDVSQAPTVPSKKRMIFSNMSDAQSVAATVNYSMRNRSLPAATANRQSMEAWEKMKVHFGDRIPDAREMAEFLEDAGFSIRYAQKPEEMLEMVNKLVDGNASPASSGPLRAPRTHEEMLNAARDIMPGSSADDALAMAERVFGATERLPEQLLALRAVLWSHGRALRRLSQLVESSPNNKLAMDQLASGLDTLMDLHARITGASANTARALNVHGLSQGRVLDKLGDPGLVAKEATNGGQARATNSPAEAPGSPVGASEAPAPASPSGAADNVAQESTEIVPSENIVAGMDATNHGAVPASGLQGNVPPVGKAAGAAEPTGGLGPRPTPKPGAPTPAVAEDVAAGAKAQEPLAPTKPNANIVPTADGAATFQTVQALKDEMKSWERLLKDLKSRPDRAANQVAISEAAAKVSELSGKIQQHMKSLPKQPKYLAPMGRKATEGLTMDQIKSLARNVFMADGDPAAILWALRGAQVLRMANKLTDRTMARKMFDWAMSFRVEGLLSGPPTFIGNMFSNIQVMLTRPAEYWMAGFMPNRNGSWNPAKWKWAEHPELRQEGADMLTGLFAGWRDSWAASKKAFMSGQNVLDPIATVNDSGRAALLGWQDSSWLQKIVHLPSRSLMAADELFKQLNYRTSMRAQILRHAREMGVTDPKEIARRLVDDLQMSFGPNGGVNPKALEYAQTNTFTNPLEYGWGKSLQDLGERHPWFNFIMPFKRTPTNIFRYVWQRTPLLNQFQKQMVDDLAAGGERAALAQAKTAMGVAIWGTGSLLVASGVITGRGPTDPKLRQQKIDTGWQPYSIRVGDRYVSYRKGDPVATSLGMIADIAQVTGELREKDQKFYISAAIAAIISNLTNKSYMQGLTDVMDAASSGDENRLNSFATAALGSFVPNILRRTDPMVNVGGQAPGQGAFEDSNWVFDDSSSSPIREARGFVDGMLGRIPGFSSTLEPHRNVFGEKVMRPPGYLNQAFNPFTVSGKVDDDSIQSELIQVGKALSMPSPTLFNGLIDLKDRNAFDVEEDGTDHGGQSPYDRMLEIMANPPEGMRPLKDELAMMVKSKDWQEIHGEDVYGKGGMKHELIQNMVSQYHEVALAQVRTEYKQLGKAYFQAMEVEAMSKVKGKEGVREVMQKYESLWNGKESPVRPKIQWKE